MNGEVARKFAIFAIFVASAIVIVELLPEGRTRVDSEALRGDVGSESARFLPVGTVPDLFVAYATGGDKFFGIDDAFIYRSDDDGQSFQRVGKLPEKYPSLLNNTKEIIARSKIVRWLRPHAGPKNLVVLGLGTVLVIGSGGIFRSTDDGDNFSLVFDLEKHSFHGPEDNGVAVTPDDIAYFGEYVADQKVHPIHILQDWRIVTLLATERYLYWGSDNDTPEGSSIFRWDFDTSQLEEQQYIGKPGYFSTILKDGTLVISTAYEPESPYSQATTPDASSDIWVSRDGENWQRSRRVAARGGDGVLKKYRAYLTFPGGEPLPQLVYSQTGTIEDDSTTFLIPLTDLAAARRN